MSWLWLASKPYLSLLGMVWHILFIIYFTKLSYILVNSLTLKWRGISLLQLEENLGEVARTLLCFTNKNKNILTWDIDGTILYEKTQESVSFRVWEIYIRCLNCVKTPWSHLWVRVGFFMVCVVRVGLSCFLCGVLVFSIGLHEFWLVFIVLHSSRFLISFHLFFMVLGWYFKFSTEICSWKIKDWANYCIFGQNHT